jgi:hypothetical protein
MPAKESLLGDKQKIVIFSPDVSDFRLAKPSHTDMAISIALETSLAEVETVGRYKLQKELGVAESKGKLANE